MSLDQLQAKHGTLLGEKVLHLRQPQQIEITDAVMEYGFVGVANALEIPADALSMCMEEQGYRQCTSCEEWFPELELDEALECGECHEAEDYQEEPPPLTPEQIVAREETIKRDRAAAIRQAERRATRERAIEEGDWKEPQDASPRC